MLPKQFRLTLNKDIERVWKTDRSFLTKFLNFKIIKNNLERSRFCIIVSSKVDKRTMIKNRLKRQINEILRLNMNNIKSGFDVAILVKSAVMDKRAKKIKYNYQEMEKNILWALKKNGLMVKN